MMNYLLTVLALLLVIEGFLPAVSPRNWRLMMFKLMQYNEKTIRIVGLFCMMIGALILYLLRIDFF